MRGNLDAGWEGESKEFREYELLLHEGALAVQNPLACFSQTLARLNNSRLSRMDAVYIKNKFSLKMH